MKRSTLNKILISLSLTVCFALFQNFSLDQEFRDIRTFAPEGVPEQPRSGYFPEHIKSTSLQSLGNELLKHNFNDDLKHLENRFEDWAGWEIGHKPSHAKQGVEPNGVTTRAPSSYRLRTGHLGKDRVGIMFENDFRFKCEFSAFSQEMQLSLDKSLGHNANLTVKHKTEDQQSSVNFTYAW